MTKLRPPDSTRLADCLIAVILFVVPFHAFLTVWAASLVGHYTLLRLWDDILLAILTLVALYWIARDQTIRQWLARTAVIRVIAVYILLSLLLGLVSYTKGEVTTKALAYGLLVNLRYLVFFIVTLLTAQRSPWLATRWLRLLLVPAAVVTLFAVLQYTVLPHNFLAHFGYGPSTIAPSETINNDAHYIRVQSTLRGANPLGAYLVIVTAAAVGAWAHYKKKWLLAMAGIFSLLALLFSFSRSAWIGAVVAMFLAAWLPLRSKHLRLISGGITVLLVIVASVGFLLLRNGSGLQNALYHTDTHSRIAVSSNQAHVSALRRGLSDVVHEPFGRGPGTAGPASVYNGDHGTRIAENYYVQIAQETGWTGLLLFVAILVLIAYDLYQLRQVSSLALILFASFIGLLLVNMLSHAWADDTLAYIWWGLAGIALAPKTFVQDETPMRRRELIKNR